MGVSLNECERLLLQMIDVHADNLYINSSEVKNMFSTLKYPSEIYRLFSTLRALQGMKLIELREAPGVGGGYMNVETILITPEGMAYFPLKEDMKQQAKANRKMNFLLGIVIALVSAITAMILTLLVQILTTKLNIL